MARLTLKDRRLARKIARKAWMEAVRPIARLTLKDRRLARKIARKAWMESGGDANG